MLYHMGMFIRTTSRRNKDGSTVTYVQLAHNQWDPQARCAKAKVLYNFGRAEQVDQEALKRLVGSITRFLGPEEALALQSNEALSFQECHPWGGSWALDQLWAELGLPKIISRLAASRKFQAPLERLLFGLAANRALDPASKRSAAEWLQEDVIIEGLDPSSVQLQSLYRVMDFLLETQPELEHQVYCSVVDLLNLEVDLLYFDTTSTYFQVEDVSEDDLRQRGHSKDHRPDLPQVVIGLAVTREGIPIRSWVWPGRTADVSVVEQVKRDLVGWKLGRVISVVDRGFISEKNLKALQRCGGHYIAGEKLRDGKGRTEEALSRPGRYHSVRDNLEVKEIFIGEGEARLRYILVRNPKQVERDRAKREELLLELEGELTRLGQPNQKGYSKGHCALISHPSYGRFLKLDREKGKLSIDREKVKEEERLDGKYLLRTSDDTLSPEDIALGYKQLLLVEASFRSLKTSLELRPVYHRLEDRIRAHVLLCWLALLLVRLAENRSGQTWRRMRQTLGQVYLGKFQGSAGTLWQRTELSQEQESLFKSLRIPPPPKISHI